MENPCANLVFRLWVCVHFRAVKWLDTESFWEEGGELALQGGSCNILPFVENSGGLLSEISVYNQLL